MLRDKWSQFTDSGAAGFNHAAAAAEHAWTGGWLLVAVVLLGLSTLAEWLSEWPGRHRDARQRERDRDRLARVARQRRAGAQARVRIVPAEVDIRTASGKPSWSVVEDRIRRWLS